MWFQSKPKGVAASWECGKCGFDVWEEPTQHRTLRHDWKTALLECRHCAHQDIICDDFRDHLKIQHDVDTNIETDAKLIEDYWREVGTFKKLLFCRECWWRNSSETKMREHKRKQHQPASKARPTTSPAAPPPTNGSTQKPVATPASSTVNKGAASSVGASVTGEASAQASTTTTNSCPSCFCHRSDCNNLDEMRNREIDFDIWMHGDFMPTGPNVKFVRSKLFLDCEPHPGTYEMIPDSPGERPKLDIVYHYLEPRRFSRGPRYTSWNEERYPYELFMMTTRTQPSTVPIVVYATTVPPMGYYSLMKTGSTQAAAQAYIGDRFLYSY